MRLTLAQITVDPGSVQGNVERASDAIERAAADGADLVVLPELFNVGYFAFELYGRRAEALDGETLTTIRDTAVEEGVAVLAGSIVEDLESSAAAGIPVPTDDGLANTAVFFDRDGERRAVYRKHHLFGYGSAESDLLEPGQRLPTVEYEGFTVGISTCYDLRFPKLHRQLVEKGATLTLVPSAWPYPRVEHWKLFPRARAVENLLYVAAANGVGTFDQTELLGRSTIFDPWGTTLASSSDDPALVTADVDPGRVERVRDEFPALEDVRTDW
ncbi:carbon-nitrogen family hydrolase [Halomicroarcula sp. GCM10025324]|jgi:predicted amidohydrolase|uniref:carbon-nitrogen family hydrolase n=1 Tax=Haloarcula TaxID=2237 RepID=UPI0023E8EBF1|nr:carbon-nitrogen family hydrolase [Halomicroarcula sp. ZS-22-S1]